MACRGLVRPRTGVCCGHAHAVIKQIVTVGRGRPAASAGEKVSAKARKPRQKDADTAVRTTTAEVDADPAAVSSRLSVLSRPVVVINGITGDPYDAFIRAKETELRLVMINGIARYGVAEVMQRLAPSDQTVRVGGQTRRLFLKQETADPDVAQVSLSKTAIRWRALIRNYPSRLGHTVSRTIRVACFLGIVRASAISFFCRFTYGFTYAGGMSRTVAECLQLARPIV